MILQWENIDYGMGLDPQIWYNCEHKLTTQKNTKNQRTLFEPRFEQLLEALCSTPGAEKDPHDDAFSSIHTILRALCAAG